MNNLSRWIIIIISVLLLSLYYNYPDMTGMRPQSIHSWRQSDCAMVTMNFYQKNLPFWKPEINGLVSDYGTNGKNATSEIPVYYWAVAQLYKIFGPHESILRAINTIFFLAGIAAFIWALFKVSGSLPWSLLLGLLLFTSPVLVYYGNNFITNTPAFGMALCSLSFFVTFIKHKKKSYWWWAVFLFLMAGSLKLPGLFFFFAIGASLVFTKMKIGALNIRRFLLAAAIILIPIGTWIIYAHYFNVKHHTTYFSTTTFPIWSYTPGQIDEMVKLIYEHWKNQYFHPYTGLFFGFLLILILIRHAQIDKRLLRPTLMLLPGVAIYFVLQFYTFVDHDYYTINLFILIAAILLCFSDLVKKTRPRWLQSPLVLVLLVMILACNAWYAKSQVDFRYSDYPNNFKFEHPELYENTQKWLQELGVAKSDTIVFVRDGSHLSLYLLNRYGWTDHKMEFKDTTQTIRFNQNAEGIRKSIEHGAKYLFVPGVRNLYEMQFLYPFEKHLTGRHGNIFVFNLKDTTVNFHLPEKEIQRRYFHDFESDSNQNAFKDLHITQEVAHSGKYAVKGAAQQQFLAEIKLDSLQPGMTLEATVWLKVPEQAKVLPVLSSEENGLAFAQEYKLIKREKGWIQLKQELTVTQAIAKKGAKFFLWNPAGIEYYFDDIRVTVYSIDKLEKQ